jgi:hypothetical protein
MRGCCCSRESRVLPSSIPRQQRKLRCDDPLIAATAASSSQRHSDSISYQRKCKRSSTRGERQEETVNTLHFFKNGICKWEKISKNQKMPQPSWHTSVEEEKG